MLNEEYKQSKEASGIITSLPEGERPPEKPKKQAKQRSRIPVVSSAGAKDIRDAILQMTDAFCRKHLNEEYAGRSEERDAVKTTNIQRAG